MFPEPLLVLCRARCRRRSCPHAKPHPKMDMHVWLRGAYRPGPAGSGCDLPCKHTLATCAPVLARPAAPATSVRPDEYLDLSYLEVKP